MRRRTLLCITSILFSIIIFSSCRSAPTDSDSQTDITAITPTRIPEVTATPIPTATPVVTIPPITIVISTPTPAENTTPPTDSGPIVTIVPPSSTPAETPATPKRDSTPYCPVSEAPGIHVVGNDFTQIDLSNVADGYIMAKYTGTCPKVKIIITGPASYKHTYDLNSAEYLSFPLTGGDGSYSVGIYENIEGNAYSTFFTSDFDVALNDEFSPFLRPSQYINYSSDTKAVQFASELCKDATNDLECIKLIYDYIIQNITYDYDKQDAVESGKLTDHLSNVDATLETGTGICSDYAALMTCMLRSQRIPTRFVTGYVGEEYHAWVSVYTSEIGWVNRIAEFDGEHWVLMDPTFAASKSQVQLKKVLENPSYYIVKYIY